MKTGIPRNRWQSAEFIILGRKWSESRYKKKKCFLIETEKGGGGGGGDQLLENLSSLTDNRESGVVDRDKEARLSNWIDR